MRRLLYLAALSMVATLMFAPTALAQGITSSGGTGPYGCPEEAPFAATAPGDPGEASLLCFHTQALADYYSATGQVPQDDAAEDQYVPASEDQYAAADQYTPAADQYAAPADDTAVLPASGGPALLLPAGVLLLGAGLLGLRMVRRS